jgi:hypothetical protein
MAYRTSNGATTDTASEYSGIAITDETERKLDAVLRDAERLVAYYAPAPDLVDPDYTAAARDAEWRIFEYLATTEGFLTSGGIGGVSENYVDFDKVKSIIMKTVGLYTEDGSPNVGYVERW